MSGICQTNGGIIGCLAPDMNTSSMIEDTPEKSCAYLKARYRVRLPNKACKAIRSPADLVGGSRLGNIATY